MIKIIIFCSVVYSAIIAWGILANIDASIVSSISIASVFLVFLLTSLYVQKNGKSPDFSIKKHSLKLLIGFALIHGGVSATVMNNYRYKDCNKHLNKDNKEFIECIKLGASSGNAAKQAALASAYYYGEFIEKDIKQAFIWAEKSANYKNPWGTNLLGVIYEDGVAVKQDLKKAASLYEQSSSSEFPIGMYNYGRVLWNGIGVERDTDKGKNILEKAGQKGLSEANDLLRQIKEIEK